MSGEPDYLICIECDTPVYVFDWDEIRLKASDCLCPVCGNDDPVEFQTEEQFMGED